MNLYQYYWNSMIQQMDGPFQSVYKFDHLCRSKLSLDFLIRIPLQTLQAKFDVLNHCFKKWSKLTQLISLILKQKLKTLTVLIHDIFQ